MLTVAGSAGTPKRLPAINHRMQFGRSGGISCDASQAAASWHAASDGSDRRTRLPARLVTTIAATILTAWTGFGTRGRGRRTVTIMVGTKSRSTIGRIPRLTLAFGFARCFGIVLVCLNRTTEDNGGIIECFLGVRQGIHKVPTFQQVLSGS